MAYHGAEHSRFGHVLGTMHVAGKALEKIKKNSMIAGASIDITDNDLRLARFAALLHDIGHYPFSHALDKIIPDNHEKYSAVIIKNAFASIIEKTDVKPNDVVDLIEGKPPIKKSFLSSLINGQLDVDKFDYLLRDSHYAGVKYGIFDLDRLLDSLAVLDEQLVVLEKGYYAAEQLILARYHMFEQLYHHHVKRSLENMTKIVAKYLLENNKLNYPTLDELSDGEQLSSFAYINDMWLFNKMKASDNQRMLKLTELIENREPFSVILDSEDIWRKMENEEDPSAGRAYINAVWSEINSSLVKKSLDESEIVKDEVGSIPYKLRPYERLPNDEEGPDAVYIYNKKVDSKKPIEELSLIVKNLAISRPRRTRMYVDRGKYDLVYTHLKERYPALSLKSPIHIV